MASMTEARAALQPAFDCEPSSRQPPTGKTDVSHRKKLIVGCSMVMVFGAAVMLGYFALGPFVQNEVIDSGVQTQKFVATGIRPVHPARSQGSMMASKMGSTGFRTTLAQWGLWKKQDFMEFEPYYDQKTMPLNTYKPKAPYMGKVLSVETITGAGATGETCNIVIDHGGKMPYIEGQSAGVVPPGTNPKNGKAYGARLYSIASSRYGDDMKGTTTTLCVRRATYWDSEMGKEDPAKKGVCSNFLCDAKAGDEIQLTGPTGKVMLLPEDKPETDIIMVATGTGIAPYRAYWRRLFIEETPYGKAFTGLAWLFLGVANTDALLYDEEIKGILKKNPDRFRYDVALSREQKNKAGDKMYIQDRVEEYADEVFDRLDKGAHIYFCGLKGMMPGIEAMLKKVAASKEMVYEDFIKKLKKGGQWHVEVY